MKLVPHWGNTQLKGLEASFLCVHVRRSLEAVEVSNFFSSSVRKFWLCDSCERFEWIFSRGRRNFVLIAHAHSSDRACRFSNLLSPYVCKTQNVNTGINLTSTIASGHIHRAWMRSGRETSRGIATYSSQSLSLLRSIPVSTPVYGHPIRKWNPELTTFRNVIFDSKRHRSFPHEWGTTRIPEHASCDSWNHFQILSVLSPRTAHSDWKTSLCTFPSGICKGNTGVLLAPEYLSLGKPLSSRFCSSVLPQQKKTLLYVFRLGRDARIDLYHPRNFHHDIEVRLSYLGGIWPSKK